MDGNRYKNLQKKKDILLRMSHFSISQGNLIPNSPW